MPAPAKTDDDQDWNRPNLKPYNYLLYKNIANDQFGNVQDQVV